jgi:hypothetical protein
MNKNIHNIIRTYLLPSKSIIKSNKNICLDELKKKTVYIRYDLSKNQALILDDWLDDRFNIFQCKNYNNTKYYNDPKVNWLIVI